MRYLAFKNHEGFALYNPDDGQVTFTLEIDKATDATLGDWLDVAWFDLEHFTLLSKQSHKLNFPQV